MGDGAGFWVAFVGGTIGGVAVLLLIWARGRREGKSTALLRPWVKRLLKIEGDPGIEPNGTGARSMAYVVNNKNQREAHRTWAKK